MATRARDVHSYHLSPIKTQPSQIRTRIGANREQTSIAGRCYFTSLTQTLSTCDVTVQKALIGNDARELFNPGVFNLRERSFLGTLNAAASSSLRTRQFTTTPVYM